jgi:fermentation-respiration switch protein FrsA (DUF1100 family)
MVSRLPGWLVGGYRPLLAALRLAARLAPGLPVPLWAYLDLDRVCGQPETRRRFLTDPLGLRCYPLGFLAELVTADLAGMRDGSIRCPVLVIAATADPLFSFGYTRRVFDQIVAPAKELLVFEVDRHLLFNECVELVTDPLVDHIRRLVACQRTAEVGTPVMSPATGPPHPWPDHAGVGNGRPPPDPRAQPTGAMAIAASEPIFTSEAFAMHRPQTCPR